jgi:hypothetical protein
MSPVASYDMVFSFLGMSIKAAGHMRQMIVVDYWQVEMA